MEHTEIFNIVQQEAMKRPAPYSDVKTLDDKYTEVMNTFIELVSPDIQHIEPWAEVAYLICGIDDDLIEVDDPRFNEFQSVGLKIVHSDFSESPDSHMERILNHPYPEVAAIFFARAYCSAKFTDDEILIFQREEFYRSYRDVRKACLLGASKALTRYQTLVYGG